jgi:hypothetical protein
VPAQILKLQMATFNKKQISRWATKAMIANLEVYKIRKDFWEQLVELTTEQLPGPKYLMSATDLFALKNLLTSRGDNLSDPKRLAFQKVLEALMTETTSSSSGSSSASLEQEKKSMQMSSKKLKLKAALLQQLRDLDRADVEDHAERRALVQEEDEGDGDAAPAGAGDVTPVAQNSESADGKRGDRASGRRVESLLGSVEV